MIVRGIRKIFLHAFADWSVFVGQAPDAFITDGFWLDLTEIRQLAAERRAQELNGCQPQLGRLGFQIGVAGPWLRKFTLIFGEITKFATANRHIWRTGTLGVGSVSVEEQHLGAMSP